MAAGFGAAVGEIHTASTATSKVLTTTGSTPSTAGTRLVVCVFWINATNLSTVVASGLSFAVDKQQAATNDPNVRVAIASADASGVGLASSATITANFSGSTQAMSVQAFYLTDTGALDATGGAGSTTNGGSASSSVVTTVVNTVVIQAVCQDFSAGSTFTPTSPVVDIYNVNHADDVKHESGYRVEAAAGSKAIGGSWTVNAAPWALAGASYGSATPPPPDPTPMLRGPIRSGLRLQ